MMRSPSDSLVCHFANPPIPERADALCYQRGFPGAVPLQSALGPVIGSSALFLIGHGVSFVVNFLVGGECKSARAVTLLALSFKRCIALIAAIVVAFTADWLLPGFANTTGFVILLMALKLAWDYVLHLRERRAFASAAD